MMKRVCLGCLLGLSSALFGQTSSATPTRPEPGSSDQPVPTLRVATRVVVVAAVVRGKDGNPQGGLSKDDFILKQDGSDQSIRYFSQGSDLPLTLALLVDTSGSQRTFIGDESLASDIFFETMLQRSQDRAMLVQFDTSVVRLRDLTSSPNALHLALLGLRTRAATSPGTLLNDAVFAVSREVLAKESGRKAIVILSDGGDNGSRHSLVEAVEQAQRGDVQVYSILYSLGNAGAGRYGSPVISADPGQAILQKLSSATGGRVFIVSASLGLREIFNRIGQDLRLQYQLAYTPPPGLQPNSYHQIEVKMKDRKLSVQARKGFFAGP